MEMLRTKSIESIGDKSGAENNGNPNPYIRRFGSHIKSHFSQSRCEIFDSSDEERGSLKNQAGTQMNSMNSMGSMRVEFNKPRDQNKSSLQNLDSLQQKKPAKQSKYRVGSTLHIKNNPSIDRGAQQISLQREFFEDAPDKSQGGVPIEVEESGDAGPSRKSSINSLHSIDFDTNNLTEPGADFIKEVRRENQILEAPLSLDKRADFSETSTANNSMFRSGGEKIEEEDQGQENQNRDLDIES